MTEALKSLRVNWALLQKADVVLFQFPKTAAQKNHLSPAVQQRKEDGLCVLCGKRRDKIGLLCKKHRKYQRDYQARMRAEGRANH